MLKYIVREAFWRLSTKKDADDVAKFFEGKDTSLYNMSLAQTLETVYTKVAWLEVSERTTCIILMKIESCYQRSTDDLTEWLEKWQEVDK